MQRCIMRGRKAKTCYWCSKGNNAETFSNKIRKKKNIRNSGETLIYNISFYIFKLVFIIFLTLQETYKEFTVEINGESSRVLGMLGNLGQFY